MKIFFTASPRGSQDFGPSYKEIYSTIQKLGFQHIDDDVINLDYVEFEKNMKPTRESRVDWYSKKTTNMLKADICVFETSTHSLGVGFLIQKALEYSKPVIVLYKDDNIPYFLSGVDDEKIVVQNYTDANLKKVVKDVIQEAREKRDKRFNFFLSPKLLDYLDKAAKMEGVTKSKLLRDMILRHMRENNETAVE